MRRFVFAASAVVLFSLTAAPAAFADLEWKNSGKIMLDAAPLDEKAEAHFAFTNTGPNPVTITDVESSCGCTVATLDKRTYAHGESGEIRAVFTFRGAVGLQSKTITVTSSESGSREYTLTLQVNIPQLFDLDRYFVVWKRGDAPEAQPIKIRVLRPDVIKPVSVESEDTRFTAKLEKVDNEADTYRVLIKPENTEQQMTAAFVVKTNFPAQDPRVINVYGTVR